MDSADGVATRKGYQVDSDYEQFYKIAFEETDVAIFISAPDGRCLALNPRALSLTGYCEEELIGKDLLDLFRASGQAPPVQRDWLPKGKTVTLEGELQRKDDSLLRVVIRIRKLPDGNFLESVFDVTEQRQSEQMLRNNEELFRCAFDHAPTGMSILEPDGITCLAVNPLLCEMFGYTRDEFLGKSIHLVTHPDDLARSNQWIRKKLNGEPCESVLEKRFIHKDGHIVWGLMSVHWIKNDDGTHQMAVAYIQDITDSKKAEEERIKLEDQVRQAQKMESIGLLAGGVAHDFNNLLTPIFGYADILSQDFADGDQRQKQLQQIRAAAERAKTVARRLLAFSRKQLLELKTVDLGDIIRKFENMLRRTIREDIEISIEISPEPCQVKADPGQIEQVLLNLSINAQDAMPEGGQLVIETKTIDHLDPSFPAGHQDIRPGVHALLVVRDSGVGMDNEVIKHIFEPFYTTKELDRGTGLGLSTVYGIVKQHGGAISVSSEKGDGTTFKVFLPQTSQAKVEMIEEAMLPPDDIVGGHETILVAEDDEMVRALTCDTLGLLGYNILVAENPERCIDLVNKHQGVIHLLLTDVIMPKMNGRELYAVLQNLHPDLKVIFMSGYASDLIGRDITDQGARFIQKPFSLDQLAEVIRQTLDGNQPDKSTCKV